MTDPLMYTRDHPCFAWRKGCEKKAEVQMSTHCLCLAMCHEHAKDFEKDEGYAIRELPDA